MQSVEEQKKTAQSNAAEILQRAMELVTALKFPSHLNGYKYLTEAIRQVVIDFNLLSQLSRSLYPLVAQKYNTTPRRVNRSIQSAVTCNLDKYGVTPINELFKTQLYKPYERPTICEIIAFCVDKIHLENLSKSATQQPQCVCNTTTTVI